MKVLYYEVSDSMILKLGGKYFWYKNKNKINEYSLVQGPSAVTYGSDRIWEWDKETDTVRYIKNRNTGIMTPVDSKEFLLIQLQAKEYQYETA